MAAVAAVAFPVVDLGIKKDAPGLKLGIEDTVYYVNGVIYEKARFYYG